MEALERELIYLWYYFDIQLRQLFWYWVIGIVTGSVISVFAKDKINALFCRLKDKKIGLLGVVPASLLGIASPLCMYGTIPIAASFANKGMREDWLAAFMMSSILLNPQLIVYSAALGAPVLALRVVSCFLCGCAAGVLVRLFYRGRRYFNFGNFQESRHPSGTENIFLRLAKSLWRNVRATGVYFLLGLVLSALFQRYVPAQSFARLFGENEGLGVLMAATIGVPLYACGGGTIPLLQEWLWRGMSMGAASAFMISGPATKITNLGALKSALGVKNFALYILFVMLFSLITGFVVDLIV